MANGYQCYCNRPWMSILPPPPCPIHATPMRISGRFIERERCRGRHCDHTWECWGGITYNTNGVTWSA